MKKSVLFKDMNEKQVEALSAFVTHAVLASATNITVLVKANRAAKRGDYGRAIFLAVLWSGLARNAGNVQRSLNDKYKDVF